MGGKKRKQTIPEVIYRFDDQGTVTFISDAVRRYGHTAEESIGNNVFPEITHRACRSIRIQLKRLTKFMISFTNPQTKLSGGR
jgi:hypothetical protein